MNGNKTQMWVAASLVYIGAAMLLIGIAIPPQGEIHPSVLVAFGEALTFAGALFGIAKR